MIDKCLQFIIMVLKKMIYVNYGKYIYINIDYIYLNNLEI